MLIPTKRKERLERIPASTTIFCSVRPNYTNCLPLRSWCLVEPSCQYNTVMLDRYSRVTSVKFSSFIINKTPGMSSQREPALGVVQSPADVRRRGGLFDGR